MRSTISRRQYILPASALSVDGVIVDPMTSVRDLGIYIDADLSMRTHVQRTVSWYAPPVETDSPAYATRYVPDTDGSFSSVAMDYGCDYWLQG